MLDLSRFVAAPGADNPQLLRWGRFFKLDSDEQAKLLAEEDPIMSLAVKTLQDLSDDPAKRRIAEDRERDLLAHGHNMAVARRVGRDEGIAIGREQALLTAIEALADVLSVELTSARRAELTASGADALARRLDSLRRSRNWV